MTVFIYGLYDPESGGLRYIGKTIDLKSRFSGHMRDEFRSHKWAWLAQLKARGLKPKMKVLETIHGSDDEDWQERERWWITKSRTDGCDLTNLMLGGESGAVHSEESKIKMAKLATGRTHTPETKEKISRSKRESVTEELREKLRLINLGKSQSPETIAKRAAAMMGHVVSEETRRKIRDAQIGKFVSEETRAKIRAARARQVITDETRAKLSAAAKGRAPSPQTIAAATAAKLGKHPSEETRAKMRAARAAYFERKKAALTEAEPLTVLAS